MNLIKQIGRYQLPLNSIVVIVDCKDGGYDVQLTNGNTIHFTEEEKAAYDAALNEHAKVLQVYGMAKALGLRG